MGQILVVDDDEAYRYAVERQLRRGGHETRGFPDWRGVLEILESDESVDALVTDLSLPAGTPNGLSLALMAKRRRPDLRIVLMTSYAEFQPDAEGRLGELVLKQDGAEKILAVIGGGG